MIASLVEQLSRYPDLDLHVVTLSTGLAQVEVARREGVTVHYVPAVYRLANLTFFLINKLRLRRVLLDLQPDLIHAHIAGHYSEVAFSLGRPAVLTPHGIRHREARLKRGWVHQLVRYPLRRYEEWRAIRQAAHIISISPYVEQEFRGVIRGPVYPIENPVDDLFFDVEDRQQPFRLLFVGHLTPRKGVFDLIRTLPALRQRFPEVQVHLAGKRDDEYDPGYFPAIQGFIRDHGLAACVHFLGQLEQPALLREYAECAVLVLPSLQETAPCVIEQAMAAGKAVVATRVGGVPYLVAPEATGLLVEPGQVAQLGAALGRLLADDTLRRAMGRRARQEAERRFRAAAVARQHYEVYRRVLAEHAPSALALAA